MIKSFVVRRRVLHFSTLKIGKICTLVAFGMVACVSVAGLRVEEKGGTFAIRRDDVVLVSSLEVDNGSRTNNLRQSFSVLERHGRVWNVWCEGKDGRCRLEVAERPDGAVEITMAGQVGPYDRSRARKLNLFIPVQSLDGRSWQAYVGDGRRVKTAQGEWTAGFDEQKMRFLATDGLVFDFNPLGAGDWASMYTAGAVKGIWQVERVGDRYYRFSGGSYLGRAAGGFTGAKIVIRPGSFEDYAEHHLVRQYNYPMHLKSSHLLAFGANRRGACFAEGNVPFVASDGLGWLSADDRQTIIGAEEGVLYSCVRGRDGRYRISGLPDGHYVFTLEAGNFTGAENRFSVSVNGETIATDVSVSRGTARQLSRAVHVTGGAAEIVLKGDYLVSAIGLQPVLGDREDYSISRGFWCAEGFEPGAIYRNSEAATPPVFRLADETYELPVPGTEADEPWREPPAPVELPDPEQPSLAWLQKATTVKTLFNSATMAELDDPDDRGRFIDELTKGRDYAAVMTSGMHSRHTYEAHLARGVAALGRIADDVHRRGMKLMDHHDATLLWNIDAGFRVLLERVQELQRSRLDGMPSFQLCPNNPAFKETYFRYLRSLIEAGVDGLQLDEVCFFADRCVCAACRNRFYRETGWKVPANELDARFNDPNSLLRKRWHLWRVRTIANWFVELRRSLKDIRPDLVLNMYTTHWGFTCSVPGQGSSSDLLELARTVNFFGTEVMPRNPMLSGRAILAHRRTKHLLNKDYGTPVWAWFYGSGHAQAYFSWALATMCGQIPLLPELPPDATAVDFRSFAALPAAFDRSGAEPIARVALYFSAHSRDWGPHWHSAAEHLGTAQGLDAMHVPYEVLGERSLNESVLSKYRVLFVGAAECLSDAEIETILVFARRGGKVRLGARAGTRNEIGEERSVWPFSAALGCAPTADEGGAVVDRSCGAGVLSYDPTERGRRFEFKELGPRDVNRYDPDRSGEAAFWRDLADFTKESAVWQTDAPNRVYTSLWRERNGDVVIHFLNAAGGEPPVGVEAPPATPDPPFPPLGRDISFTVRAGQDVVVTAVSPDFAGVRTLDSVRHGDGRITVVLPKSLIKAYTLVRLSRPKEMVK